MPSLVMKYASVGRGGGHAQVQQGGCVRGVACSSSRIEPWLQASVAVTVWARCGQTCRAVYVRDLCAAGYSISLEPFDMPSAQDSG